MHPPPMVHNTNGPMAAGSKGCPMKATGGGGKATKDRQNAENIVPTFHQNGSSGGNEPQANAKKVTLAGSTHKTCNTAQPTATAPQPAIAAAPAAVSTIKTVSATAVNGGSSVISTLNSANRRKTNRNNSPNRRRREQQNIYNSLRAWNVKIVPSRQTTVQQQDDCGALGGEKQFAAGSNAEPSKTNSSERSSSVSSTTTSGSMSSSVTSNTSSSSNSVSSSSSSSLSDSIKDINGGLLKGSKKRGGAVSNTCSTVVSVKEPIATATATVQNVKKKEEVGGQPTDEAVNGEAKGSSSNALPVTGSQSGATGNSYSKGEKKLWNGGFSANPRHPAATISSSHSSSVGSVIPSSSLPPSSVAHSSSQASPVTSSISSPAVLTTSPTTNHSRHNIRAANAGKVLQQPNVNSMAGGTPLDPVVMLQGKLRNSTIGPPLQQPHHISSHHHSTHSHVSAQGQQQQQQPMPPTTPPHYSLDFLHYVGMRMSTANGTSQSVNTSSSATASAFLRANPHFNYNHFNQQLQQQQLIHQHQQQQQQQQQHQQQPFQHLQRHYPPFYNCDELLLQSSAVGDPMYASFSVSDHLATTTAAGGTGGGTGTSANDSGMVYSYSQNNQNHHHQHQQQHPMYHQNHSHHQQQQQQSFGNGGGFHHNNNYQHHNRNYGRAPPGGGGNFQNGGGKKTWNSSWSNGKRIIHGKYGNKNSGYNYGYRKNYNYHNNHYGGGGGGHHYDHNQNQQQSDALRNLIYIKGYNSGQRAADSHGSTSRSPTPSPQSASPSIDATEASHTIVATRSVLHDERSDSGIEESVNKHKKSGTVPSSSSSSSSMVSIPSTESSTLSASAVQNLSLELELIDGQGYESDSSHSSSYKSNSYRHRKYTSSGQVYRSSSSTSSGVSSTATFPPLTSDYCSMSSSSAAASNNPLTTMSVQMTDFFLRSQSYHGSHQNLTAVSASTSPNPPDSPISTPHSMIGTQSMPMFSELFTVKRNHQAHHQQPQQSHQQKPTRSQPSSHYGSDNSLELALPIGDGNSGAASVSSSNSSCSSSSASHDGCSGYGSASASTVPPNEVLSMQSGHPMKRYSGRTSPTLVAASQKSSRPPSANVSGSSIASSQQLSPTAPHHQSLVQAANVVTSPTASKSILASPVSPPANGTYLYAAPLGGVVMHTPADRFLVRPHLVELTKPPSELAPSGCNYGPLSIAIWEKFAAAQQTQEKYLQKMQLWRNLYMLIKQSHHRFSLYLVGSSIAGFAANSSDVDMCVVYRNNTPPQDMRQEALDQLVFLKNYFMNINSSFEEFSVIQAKVPILRFRDSSTSIVVDLNYNNCVGIRNTHLLSLYAQKDWRLRPLTLFVKLWAQHHNINDAKNMTISSYSLVLMVIHFLQYGVSPPILPCLHAMYPEKFVRMPDISTIDLMEKVEPYKNDNPASLGELFLQFLEYYAHFDYTNFAISVRTASVISIESARVVRTFKNDPHHWRQLCIEEPFDLTNTARSVFDAVVFEQIKSVFSTCWRRLKDTNDLSSIFDCEPLFIPVVSALSITS